MLKDKKGVVVWKAGMQQLAQREVINTNSVFLFYLKSGLKIHIHKPLQLLAKYKYVSHLWQLFILKSIRVKLWFVIHVGITFTEQLISVVAGLLVFFKSLAANLSLFVCVATFYCHKEKSID